MTLNQFTKAISRQPFRPFQMITTDKKTFYVDHPEFASIDREGREVTFHDSFNVRHDIDANLIVEITAFAGEVLAGTTAPNPNGGD